MRIESVIAHPALASYFCEDVTALQKRPTALADRYDAPASAPGFRHVREPGEAVSIGLVLENGTVAWGDCVGVAYAGKAGRDPVFRAREAMGAVAEIVGPALEGRTLEGFRASAERCEAVLTFAKLHVAIRYGVSQALLAAHAMARGVTMAEIVAED